MIIKGFTSIPMILKLSSLALLLTCSVGALSYTWTQLELSEQVTSGPSIVPEMDLLVNSATVCVFDSLTVSWKLKDDTVNVKNAMLAISMTGQKLAFVTPLAKRLSFDLDTSVDGYTKGVAINNGIIKCLSDIDEQFCIPVVRNLHSLTDQNKLALEFKQDTNQPSLATASLLDAALHFTPALFGAAQGEWTAPNRLEIKVDPEYLEIVLKAFAEKQNINIEPNTDGAHSYESHGSVSFRPQSHGQLTVLAFDRVTQLAISNSVILEASLCEEKPLLPDLFQPTVSTDQKPTVNHSVKHSIPQPAVQLNGVFAVSGLDDLRFEHSSLPFLSSGNWSLSFWFRLLEGPTGVHRTLLYKGNPSEVGRTPSVWLLPSVNRLAIRLSTKSDPDSGTDSTVDIPLNQWTHIAMVFTNHSSSTTTTQYSTALYVNGMLDVSLKYNTPVVGNEGSVHLFKDVSHSGPRSIVSDLVIWDQAVNAKKVKQLYSQGLDTIQVQPVDDVIQVFLDAHSSLLPDSLLQHYSTTSSALSTSSATSSSKRDGDNIAQMLLDKARTSTQSCDLFETRLDLYAEAAERGSAEALHLWAMMVRYGYESSASGASCGYEKATAMNAEQDGDQQRALLAFVIAADMGFAPALVPLAISVLTGLGVDVLLHPKLSVHQFAVPVSRDYIETVDKNRSTKEEVGSFAAVSVLENTKGSAVGNKFYRVTPLHHYLSEYLLEATVMCQWKDGNEKNKDNEKEDAIHHGYSVLCPSGPHNVPSPGGAPVTLADPTQLALGLLYLASVHNIAEAQLILSYRYQYGLAVLEDLETASQYSLLAAAAASEDYHKVGGQPIIEADRINDKTAREIPSGNTGDDDTLIQHQMVRASEGNVPAMMAMGDLYYYGARGLPRDQGAALRYFEQAAVLGSDDGKCAAAGMYLKGEGTAQNSSKGVELYKDAAQRDSVRAFNGLGYIYYFGAVGIAQNTTEAFYYFMKAAESETEPDSLFNAGYCLEHGVGVEKNFSRSVALYTIAAKKFGHFDAVKSLAWTYMEGRESITRSPTNALQYLNAAKYIGSWSGWLRRGLDNYLSGNKMGRALACYLHAGEVGYEVSQSNAAYVLKSKVLLYQPHPTSAAIAAAESGNNLNLSPNVLKKVKSKLLQMDSDGNDLCNQNDRQCFYTDYSLIATSVLSSSVLSHRLLSRQYGLSIFHGNKDNSLELGTCFFKGACGVSRDYTKAIYYYTQASAQDNALASLYLGVINHFGIGVGEANIPRANRYYTKALTVGGLETQLQYMTKLLQQSLSLVNHSWLSSFHLGLEYVVKMLWGGM